MLIRSLAFLSRWGVIALAAGMILAGCTTAPVSPAPAIVRVEPVNLSVAKAAVIAYVDDGSYGRDIAAVALRAGAYLEERAARAQKGERMAVVFDLDETLLSNLPHMRAMDFGYLPGEWEAWVKHGDAPVIEPMRDVFMTARRLGMDVFLLSGRMELRDRAGTEKNLLAAGLTRYTLLMLKPDGEGVSTTDYKTAARQRIEREGYIIVANLGDQESDLAGGFAERTFKVPDPFYLIP